jgi:hypothetical protein
VRFSFAGNTAAHLTNWTLDYGNRDFNSGILLILSPCRILILARKRICSLNQKYESLGAFQRIKEQSVKKGRRYCERMFVLLSTSIGH